MTRQTASTLGHVHAECQQCDWTADSRNAVGIAARHHDQTGHTVTVDVVRTIIYGDPNAQITGQTSLTDELEPAA